MTPDFPTLTAIAAMSLDRTIGKDGAIPWRCPADLKRFKAVTMGKALIVGRETFDGLPPLPGRKLIIVSRSQRRRVGQDRAHVNDIDGAFQAIKRWNVHPLDGMVIGGEQIYRLFWPHVRRILLTTLSLNVTGDRFFPIDPMGHAD